MNNKKQKINILEYGILSLSWLVVFLLIGGITFALLGKFPLFAYWLAPLTIVLSLIWKIIKIRGVHTYFRKFEFWLIIIIFLFSLVNGLFYHQNLGAIRDHGGYVADAVTLVKEGRINPDPGYNYSSFSKAVFTDQFVFGRIVGYPIYLALFYAWAGLKGLFMANSLLLFLTLNIFYLLGKRLKDRLTGVIFITLFACNFLTIYFSRRTLSENLMLFLFWLAAYLFIKSLHEKKYSIMTAGLIPLLISLLVRVEGTFFLIFFIIAILIVKYQKKIRWSQIFLNKNLLVIGLIILLLANYAIFYLPPSYTQIVRGARFIIRPVVVLTAEIIPAIGNNSFVQEYFISNETYVNVVEETRKINDFKYVFSVLSFYFIIPYILLVIIGFYQRKFKWKIILLGLIALPSLLYLYDPLIVRDQPWALRRYWSVFIPYIILVSSVYLRGLPSLKRIKPKKVMGMNTLTAVIITIIVIINLNFTARIFPYAENHEQDEELQALAEKFNPQDIIVFSDNYYDPLGRFSSILKYHYGLDNIIWPAYNQKKSPNVNLATINDYIQSNKYKKIYIISSTSPSSEDQIHKLFDNGDLINVDKFSLNMSRLLVPSNKTEYPPTIPKISTTIYYIYQYQNP